MSIREEAELLCRAVRESPAREGLRDLLWGLNVSSDGRSGFGLPARRERAQVLGYLMVNQERAALEAAFPQNIPSLTEEELSLLAGTHREIVGLNRRCVSALVEALPHCNRAVDPYNRYQYDELLGEAGLLREEEVARVADAFRRHPAAAAAVETAPGESAGLFADNFMQAVWQMEESLIEAGPHRTPEELWRAHTSEPEGSGLRRRLRHLGALLCVRDSLYNLDQLVYHAILGDGLFTLDDENLTHLSPISANLTGRGLLATYLPPRGIHLTECNDLVRVDCRFGDERLDWLCRVEAHCDEPSPSFGEGERMDLRTLDESLNSYGSLYQL